MSGRRRAQSSLARRCRPGGAKSCPETKKQEAMWHPPSTPAGHRALSTVLLRPRPVWVRLTRPITTSAAHRSSTYEPVDPTPSQPTMKKLLERCRVTALRTSELYKACPRQARCLLHLYRWRIRTALLIPRSRSFAKSSVRLHRERESHPQNR